MHKLYLSTNEGLFDMQWPHKHDYILDFIRVQPLDLLAECVCRLVTSEDWTLSGIQLL